MSVKENEANGTVVGTVRASDADIGDNAKLGKYSAIPKLCNQVWLTYATIVVIYIIKNKATNSGARKASV